MWFGMAEWIKRGGAIPEVPGFLAELTTPRYFFRNGKLWIEEKDMIKAQLQRSPDLGDALAQTFALPDAPAVPEASRMVRGIVRDPYETPDPFDNEQRQAKWDYDPLEEGR